MPASERSLAPLAGPSGVLCTLALDHRAAMRNAFRRAGVADVSDETMLEVKTRIAGVLGGRATGILLVPLEEQESEALDGGRLNRLTADFGACEARGLGADGCKLLLHFRADHPTTAALQRDVSGARPRTATGTACPRTPTRRRTPASSSRAHAPWPTPEPTCSSSSSRPRPRSAS